MNFNKHNTTLTANSSQSFYKTNPYPPKEVEENLEGCLRNELTRIETGVLNDILLSGIRHKTRIIYPSQIAIAERIGCSRRSVNRSIVKLEKIGFISKLQRWNTSCVYKISALFFNPHVQSKVSHILTCFRKLSLSLLFSSIISASHNVSLLNIQGLYGNIKLLNRTGQRAEVFVPYEDPMIKFAQRIYGDDPVSPMIRQLNTHHSMNLSQYAMFKLSAFPDEAIEWASSKLQYTNTIRDPYNWMFKMCHDYCKDNDILPDWYYAANLIVAHDMPKDSAIYGEKVIAKPKLFKQKRYVPKPEHKYASSAPIDIPKRKQFEPDTKRRFGKSIYKPTLSPVQEQFASRFPVPEFLKNSTQGVE